VLVLAFTGIRSAKAIALLRGSVQPASQPSGDLRSIAEVTGIPIRTNQDHQQRVRRASRFLKAKLETHLEDRVGMTVALVFTAVEGGPIRYSNFRSQYWNRAVRKAGLAAPLGMLSCGIPMPLSLLVRGASRSWCEPARHGDPLCTGCLFAPLDDDLDALADRLDDRFGRDGADAPSSYGLETAWLRSRTIRLMTSAL